MANNKAKLCRYCGEPIDPGQEFVFLVEAQEFEEQVGPMALVEMAEHYHGEPLRTCKECRTSIEENLRDIEERDARERVRAGRYRLILSAAGIALLLFFLGCLIADLLR